MFTGLALIKIKFPETGQPGLFSKGNNRLENRNCTHFLYNIINHFLKIIEDVHKINS